MATHIGNPASTYYAKPVLTTAPASWASDVLTPTTVPNFPGRFEFTFDADSTYVIYEQAGGSPASTDQAIATWEPVPPTSTEIADTVLRRSTANVEASSTGDPLAIRSLYGMVAQAVHNTRTQGSKLIVTKSDDSTQLATRTLTTNSSAEPITGLDSD